MTHGTDPSYADLLVRLQPQSIQNDEEAATVQSHIDALIDQDELPPAEQTMLFLLGDLTAAWERNRYDLPDLPPAEAVRAMLEAHGMKQGDLVGRVFPTKSIASEVLSGKRRLTYDHVRKLAEIFHVSPAVFFPAERRSGVA